MVDAAAGRRDDGIEPREIAHEQGLGVGARGVEPAVRHRLPATCLVVRVHDLVPKTLEQLEGRDADFGKESIDETRNEKSYTHPMLLSNDANLSRPFL